MKICIDPLVDETLNEVREKMHLQLLALIVIFGVFFFFFFLSTILLPNESVGSLMHAAIVLNS